MAHEIEVRAANIVSAVGLVLLLLCPKLQPPPLQVRAAENLSKLVSDLKEFLILNNFSRTGGARGAV